MPRAEGGLVAVDRQDAAAGHDHEQDVALVVHVLGDPVPRLPGEQRRVEVVGRGAPERPVTVQLEQVDDVHPRTVAVRMPAYPLPVRVLGIDPGTAACGYGIVQALDGRVRQVTGGCWRTSPRDRPEARLLTIYAGVTALIEEHAPEAVALEESFVGADARIALFVGQARGAAMVAAADAGIECTEYAPNRVKQSICGHGHAEKGQMQRMVKMLLSLDELPATSHEADALAVAICHALMPPLARMVS
jgi:crossover junction endodeoxyribonuclease RuvC